MTKAAKGRVGDHFLCLATLAALSVAVTTVTAQESRNSVRREDCRELAQRLLATERVRSGLCVHIDCGGGELTAELGLNGQLLVQGLTAREGNVEKAREYIRSRGIYGHVSVDHSRLVELPYADNLVNVLIVEDYSKARDRGLRFGEMMRVVAPLGTMWLKETGSSVEKDLAALGLAGVPAKREGAWVKFVKPWPRGLDEWTQYRHDASRSATSVDRFVRPCTSLRWVAGDRWAHWSLLQAVSANGRNNCIARPRIVNRLLKVALRRYANDISGLLWHSRIDRMTRQFRSVESSAVFGSHSSCRLL